jgi:exopolysaccharide biosynthesis operon protein EpsL
LVAGFSANLVFADEKDVLNFVVGGSVTHDSNLFRLSNTVNPVPITGSTKKGDTLTAAYAGIRIDKPYSLQRFQLDVTGTMYRYDNFSFLNWDAFEYRGAWLWHVTPRLGGTLSAEHKQALVPFEDFRTAQQRNVRDIDTRRFDLNWRALGALYLLFGISTEEQKSEVPFLAEADFKATNYEGGVRYDFASGSSVSFLQHLREGDYLNRAPDPTNFTDNSYREYESEARFNWAATGHSSFDGRLGWLDRRHERFSQRDFSGVVGELAYAWTPTGKLRFNFSAKRDLRPFVDVFSSYRIDNTLSFVPTWYTTAKTTVSMRFDRMTSDFRGPVFAPTVPLRSDTLHSVKLIGEWAATRGLLLSASVQRAGRSSNIPDAEFDATVVNIRAGLKF